MNDEIKPEQAPEGWVPTAHIRCVNIYFEGRCTGGRIEQMWASPTDLETMWIRLPIVNEYL